MNSSKRKKQDQLNDGQTKDVPRLVIIDKKGKFDKLYDLLLQNGSLLTSKDIKINAAV